MGMGYRKKTVKKLKSQSVLEYSILVFVAVMAMLSMTVYVKRAMQGHWRSSSDDLAAQYDAKHTTSDITMTRDSLSYTETNSVIDGTVMRTDTLTAVDHDTTTRQGVENVEPMGALWD